MYVLALSDYKQLAAAAGYKPAPQLGRHTAVYLFYRITSVEKMKVLRTFILFFARLALTLHPKDLT